MQGSRVKSFQLYYQDRLQELAKDLAKILQDITHIVDIDSPNTLVGHTIITKEDDKMSSTSFIHDFKIPFGDEVYVYVDTRLRRRENRASVRCFRCGGAHHYRSECSNFKTRICNGWRNGNCHLRFCPFAHGVYELRNGRTSDFSNWMHSCQESRNAETTTTSVE